MEAAKKLHPSLPENYVTLLDLRERWMEQQKQKKREECNRDKELQQDVEIQDDQERVDVEGEDEGVDDGAQLQQHQPVEKSVFRSNPNPRPATRRPSRGRRRPMETRNCRWVQVSQPATVQASHPKPAPVVQVVEQKAVPMLHASQSKPPLLELEAPKMESAVEPGGEIRGSDEKVDDRKLDGAKMEKKRVPKRSKNRNKRKKDVVESQQEKGVLALNADPEEKENLEQGDVVESQQVKGVLAINGDPEEKENLELGDVVARGNKNVNDISKAEIKGKFAGLSLNNGTGESSSGRSMAVRNRRGWRKDEGYGKFERRVMLKKERAKTESGLVWVKKGEASEMGAIPVEKAGIGILEVELLED